MTEKVTQQNRNLNQASSQQESGLLAEEVDLTERRSTQRKKRRQTETQGKILAAIVVKIDSRRLRIVPPRKGTFGGLEHDDHQGTVFLQLRCKASQPGGTAWVTHLFGDDSEPVAEKLMGSRSFQKRPQIWRPRSRVLENRSVK